MLQLVDDFKFDGITEPSLRVDELLAHPLPYEQGLVKFIADGRVFDATSPWDVVANAENVIKVEGYEKLSLHLFEECRFLATHYKHNGPVTCHLFKSPTGASSFDMHSDPDDVVLYMVHGSKQFRHDHGVLTLEEGEILRIPAGVNHQAINTNDSVMLSFGLERFIVEKL